MTRDGTFRIRDGKVAEPLVNLRFTVAMSDVLGDVPGLTRDRMLVNLNDLYERALRVRRARAGDRNRRASTSAGPAPGRGCSYNSRW